MIPKIIHQIWFGNQNNRPKEIMDKWKEFNPGWEYFLWTENDIKKYFGELDNQKHFDEMPKLYESLKRLNKISPAFKYHHYLCGQSDIARYEILYKYGGFFIDADAIPLRPLDDELLNNDSFSVYENEIVRTGLIANGYLASTEKNQLMKILILELKKQKTLIENEPWISTGPLFLTNTIKKYKYNKIKIYPSYYFIPNHYSGIKYKANDIEHIYCDQLWGSTKNMYGNEKN